MPDPACSTDTRHPIRMPQQFIDIHHEAPAQPAFGAPCNGCGVCCLIDTCPAGRLRFRQKHGPCPALCWSAAERRYLCGLLSAPGDYLPGLPHRATPLLSRLFARWIAAGRGCDCSARLAD